MHQEYPTIIGLRKAKLRQSKLILGNQQAYFAEINTNFKTAIMISIRTSYILLESNTSFEDENTKINFIQIIVKL